MPLYSLMKRGMRLPSIGKIRKGEQVPVIDPASNLPKKKNGEIVMRPIERPYFVFTIDQMQEAEVRSALRKSYGTDQIKELNVFLAHPDAMSNFSFNMEAYNANQRVAVSDERTVTYLFDVDTNTTLIKDGVIVEHSKKPESPAGKLVNHLPIGSELPYAPDMILAQSKTSDRAITFKAVGRLTVIIRELRRVETFTVMTGGYWYDIPQIWTTIEMLDSIAQATGRGANTIPLKLRRVEREHKYTADDGSKKKRTYYDLELVIRTDIVAGLLESYDGAPFTFNLLENTRPQLPELSPVNELTEAYEEELTEAPGDSPELIAARQVTVKLNHGKLEKFMADLSDAQLKYVVEHGTDPTKTAAARLVLKADFNTEI